MANVVVMGAQWGDEGKGKIVDWLSERADIVVRFQGGHNAGHTLVVDGTTYKLSLLPSGVVRKGKLSVIGNGVVVDPWTLAEEIAKIETQGVRISPENLRIAENATLILPLHRELDALDFVLRVGGLAGTIARSDANAKLIADWVARTPWVDFVARDPETRSNTSVCLKVVDPDVQALPDALRADVPRRIAALLDAEDVANDIASYRDAPPGLRIWTGATVERSDVEALLPWLDWAFAEVKRALAQAA